MEKHFILWADDDPDDMALFCKVMEEVDQHSQVVSASDGREVLACLHELRKESRYPCLVILDMNMPAVGGRETIVRMKRDSEWAAIPVVVFSTSGSHLDRLFCHHYGVEHYIKPSSIGELKSIIGQLLGHCSHRQPKGQGAGSATH